MIHQIVKQANERLKRLAKQPKANVKPLRAKTEKLKRQMDKLVLRVANLSDEESALCESFERRIISLQKEVDELEQTIRSEETTRIVARNLTTGRIAGSCCFLQQARSSCHLF